MIRTMKFKIPIIVLSVVSLIYALVGNIVYFIDYHYTSKGWQLLLRLPNLSDFWGFLLSIIPQILFVVYVFSLFKKFKGTIIVPIIFALISLSELIGIINSIIWILKGYVIGFSGFLNIISGIFCLVMFALATVSALKGLTKKLFLVLATVGSLVNAFLSLIGFFSIFSYYLHSEQYLYLFTQPASIVSAITFNLALLLFGLGNIIPMIIKNSPSKTNVSKLSPEQSLKLLKAQLELGQITQEEYTTQRTAIINNL